MNFVVDRFHAEKSSRDLQFCFNFAIFYYRSLILLCTHTYAHLLFNLLFLNYSKSPGLVLHFMFFSESPISGAQPIGEQRRRFSNEPPANIIVTGRPWLQRAHFPVIVKRRWISNTLHLVPPLSLSLPGFGGRLHPFGVSPSSRASDFEERSFIFVYCENNKLHKHTTNTLKCFNMCLPLLPFILRFFPVSIYATRTFLPPLPEDTLS